MGTAGIHWLLLVTLLTESAFHYNSPDSPRRSEAPLLTTPTYIACPSWHPKYWPTANTENRKVFLTRKQLDGEHKLNSFAITRYKCCWIRVKRCGNIRKYYDNTLWLPLTHCASWHQLSFDFSLDCFSSNYFFINWLLFNRSKSFAFGHINPSQKHHVKHSRSGWFAVDNGIAGLSRGQYDLFQWEIGLNIVRLLS